MAHKLRHYQEAAVDAVFDYWDSEDGNPLIEMATGTGKSLSLAELFKRMITNWPDMRVVCTVHVVEIVKANYMEMLGHMPFAPAGVYASSLGMRNTRAQILFTQLQSVWDKAAQIGWVDVLAIDECHLVPTNDAAMYRKFIAALLAINPDMKIVSLSATPWRLDSGRIDEGDDRIADKTVFTYGIREGLDDGYLTPITSKPTETVQDTSMVPMSRGDLAKGALQKAVDKDWLNKQIIEEVMDTEGHRKCAAFFCSGVEHATHMRDMIRDAGKTCEVLHGGTPPGERDRIIEGLKSGALWGATNDNILSTGTNIKRLDLLVDCARTKSTSRFAQRGGRLTRVIYPHGYDPESDSADGRKAAIAGGPKPNARYMDFAGNISEHGPLDMLVPHKPKKGEGEAPIKICPPDLGGCSEQLHASVRKCWCCGYEFPIDDTPKLQERSTDAPILSNSRPEPRTVRTRAFRYHEGKGGKPPSVKVTYMCGLTAINEWLCPEHGGYAGDKAGRYWRAHGGADPAPGSVLAWLERQSELCATREVMIRPDGKYWKVERQVPAVAANDNVRQAANENVPEVVDMDDCIPF